MNELQTANESCKIKSYHLSTDPESETSPPDTFELQTNGVQDLNMTLTFKFNAGASFFSDTSNENYYNGAQGIYILAKTERDELINILDNDAMMNFNFETCGAERLGRTKEIQELVVRNTKMWEYTWAHTSDQYCSENECDEEYTNEMPFFWSSY